MPAVRGRGGARAAAPQRWDADAPAVRAPRALGDGVPPRADGQTVPSPQAPPAGLGQGDRPRRRSREALAGLLSQLVTGDDPYDLAVQTLFVAACELPLDSCRE